MVMEETKTEVAILNANINAIKSRNGNITPKTSIKYLGYYLQSNLKIDKTVDALVSRINQMAGRIWQFPCMPVKCKVTLYYAYVHSLLMSNAACILPFITPQQTIKLQRACNNAIRAIVTLRWRKNDSKPKSISKIRLKLGIPSVAELAQRTVALETWKNRLKLEEAAKNIKPRYYTRYGHQLKAPIEVGPTKWSIWPKLVKSWNELPAEIKTCSELKRAKALIKKLYSNHTLQ